MHITSHSKPKLDIILFICYYNYIKYQNIKENVSRREVSHLTAPTYHGTGDMIEKEIHSIYRIFYSLYGLFYFCLKLVFSLAC